jgi:hypothetical protein
VSLLIVQKAKPKGIATYGAEARLHWDWKQNRYYWLDAGNSRRAAFMINAPKLPNETLEPDNSFFDE